MSGLKSPGTTCGAVAELHAVWLAGTRVEGQLQTILTPILGPIHALSIHSLQTLLAKGVTSAWCGLNNGVLIEEILLRTWSISAANYNYQLLLKGLKFIHLCLGGWGQSVPKQLHAEIVKTTKISFPAHIFR